MLEKGSGEVFTAARVLALGAAAALPLVGVPVAVDYCFYRRPVFAALNIALNFYAIPRFGLLGAATATTLTTVAWNVAAGLWVARRYGIWTWYPFNRRNR